MLGWSDRYDGSGWVSPPCVETSCCRCFITETWSVSETGHGEVWWPGHSLESGANERFVRLLVCASWSRPKNSRFSLLLFAFLMRMKVEKRKCCSGRDSSSYQVSNFMQEYVGIDDSYRSQKKKKSALTSLKNWGYQTNWILGGCASPINLFRALVLRSLCRLSSSSFHFVSFTFIFIF